MENAIPVVIGGLLLYGIYLSAKKAIDFKRNKKLKELGLVSRNGIVYKE